MVVEIKCEPESLIKPSEYRSWKLMLLFCLPNIKSETQKSRIIWISGKNFLTSCWHSEWTPFVLITKLKGLSLCRSVVGLSVCLSGILLTFWTTFVLISKLKNLSFILSVCLHVHCHDVSLVVHHQCHALILVRLYHTNTNYLIIKS